MTQQLHWTEAAIAAALGNRFFLIDGTDKHEVDAKLEAERQADKNCARQELASRSKVEQVIAAQPGITPDGIITAVAYAHGIGVADLVSKSRRQHIIHARQHACALMRELTGKSFNVIASAVGIVDHSTAHWAVKQWVQRGHVYAVEDRKAREMLGVAR